MILGIDFDNTIICYDDVFYKIALEKNLIHNTLKRNKTVIRNFLRNQGKEKEWTKLQGYVYGKRIIESKPYEGVIEFMNFCKINGINVHIISHKTVKPYSGENFNLHKAAYHWLDHNGFVEKLLTQRQISFMLTKEDKIQKILDLKCAYFIDDLPEFLVHLNFPKATKRILFDPLNQHSECSQHLIRKQSWSDIIKYFNSYI